MAVLVLGVAAEWIGRPPLVLLDAATGVVCLGAGAIAWRRAPRSRLGPLLVLTAALWFLGSVAGWAAFLHRATLAQALLTYPYGDRGRSRLTWAGVGAAYAAVIAGTLAAPDEMAAVLGLVLVAAALRRVRVSGGLERRARSTACGAAVVLFLVLVLEPVALRADVIGDRAALALYDVAIAAIAVVLVVDLVRARWSEAVVAGLVVDVAAEGRGGTLRDRLATTLGDPTLQLGYWIDDLARYVDDAGRPIELDASGGRTVTAIESGGERIAALAHDPDALGDPGLVAAVATAARLAVENARLRAEVRAGAREVAASRRRIVVAADAQRRRLEQELRDGPQRHLARVAELVADGGPEIERQLTASREELAELARGIRPARLAQRGIGAALDELATRSDVPVVLAVADDRYPPAIESAVYFVCSEALANVAKHARASRVSISVGAARPACCGWSSVTTASAAPRRRPAPVCAGSPTASRRWTGH